MKKDSQTDKNYGGKRASAGRPRIIVDARRVVATLAASEADWLAKQPGGRSAKLRELVKEAMK